MLFWYDWSSDLSLMIRLSMVYRDFDNLGFTNCIPCAYQIWNIGLYWSLHKQDKYENDHSSIQIQENITVILKYPGICIWSWLFYWYLLIYWLWNSQILLIFEQLTTRQNVCWQVLDCKNFHFCEAEKLWNEQNNKHPPCHPPPVTSLTQPLKNAVYLKL